MSDFELLLQLVGNLGFPIAFAAYAIWWITKRLNGKLDKIVGILEALHENTAEVKKLTRELYVERRVRQEDDA